MVESLLFLRLLDQFCKQGAEHIGAVLSQCHRNLVDAVVQFLDSIIGGLGFRKQVGQVADERIGGIIVDAGGQGESVLWCPLASLAFIFMY